MRKLTSLVALLVLAAGVALAADDKKEEKKGKGKGGEMLAKMFKKMDTDGDGKVSKAEFTKFFEERLKDKGKGDKAGPLMARLFDRLDTDKDGYLSKEELAKFAEGRGDGKGKLKDLLKDKFNKKKGDD